MSYYNHAEFNLTHKRDEIDAEERRLIDEARAAGKVQKIPTGKSAFAADYVWEPSSKGFAGRLVLKNPMTREEAVAKFKSRFNYRPPSVETPEQKHRRSEVLRLTEEGFSSTEIADALNKVGILCTKKTISNDRKYLRRRGKLHGLSSGANGKKKQDIEARRARVLELLSSGKSNPETAKELGITEAKVVGDRRVLIDRGLLKKATGSRILP